MELFYGLLAGIAAFAILMAVARRKQPQQNITPQVNINLKPVEEAIKDIPSKVLQSITSSANTHKGALGELIGYIQLRASYDRIVPLGNIVDFMCIKFPSTDSEGHVDFIDIKTGDRSRLSKDQRELQKLIQEHKINFVKLKVDTSSANSSQ